MASGENDGEIEDPVFHGAVFDGVGARGGGCDHAAYMGIWTGINGEEEIIWFEEGVEIGPGDAWLESNVHISWSEGDDLVHFGEGDGNTVARRDTLSKFHFSPFAWGGNEEYPSRDVPPEYGMTGTRYVSATLSMTSTSSVVVGHTTALGSLPSPSPRVPCPSKSTRSSMDVEHLSSNTFCNTSIALVTFAPRRELTKGADRSFVFGAVLSWSGESRARTIGG